MFLTELMFLLSQETQFIIIKVIHPSLACQIFGPASPFFLLQEMMFLQRQMKCSWECNFVHYLLLYNFTSTLRKRRPEIGTIGFPCIFVEVSESCTSFWVSVWLAASIYKPGKKARTVRKQLLVRVVNWLFKNEDTWLLTIFLNISLIIKPVASCSLMYIHTVLEILTLR